MSTVQGLTVNYSGSTNCSQWRFDEKMTTDLWEFQRTNLRGISMDLLIFVLIIFWLNACVFKQNGTKMAFGISCLSQLLAHFQGLTSKPYARFLESEQWKQNFLWAALVGDCLLDIILIDWEIRQSNIQYTRQQFQKRNHVFFHIQSRTHIHHFSLNINTSRSLSSSISPHFAFWWMGDGSHSKGFRVYPFWIFLGATPGWEREGPFIAFQQPCHIPVVRLWHQNMSTKAGCSQVSQLRRPLLNHLSR